MAINQEKVNELFNTLPDDIKLQLGNADMFGESISTDEETRINTFSFLSQQGVPYGKMDDYFKEDPVKGKQQAKAGSGSASVSAQSKSSSDSRTAENNLINNLSGNKRLVVKKPPITNFRQKTALSELEQQSVKKDNVQTREMSQSPATEHNLDYKRKSSTKRVAQKTGLKKTVEAKGGSIVPLLTNDNTEDIGKVEMTPAEIQVSSIVDLPTLKDENLTKEGFYIPEKELLSRLYKATGKEDFTADEISRGRYEINKERVIDYVNKKKQEDPEYEYKAPAISPDKLERGDIVVPRETAFLKLYEQTGRQDFTDEEINEERKRLSIQSVDEFINKTETFYRKMDEVRANIVGGNIAEEHKVESNPANRLGDFKPTEGPKLSTSLMKYGFESDNKDLVHIDNIKSIDKDDFAKYLIVSGKDAQYDSDMSQVRDQQDQYNLLQGYIQYKTAKSKNDYLVNFAKENKALLEGDNTSAEAFNKLKIKSLDELQYNAVSLTSDVIKQLPIYKQELDGELQRHTMRQKAEHNIKEGKGEFKDYVITGTGTVANTASNFAKLTSSIAGSMLHIGAFLGGEVLDDIGSIIGDKEGGRVWRSLFKGAADYTDTEFTKKLLTNDRFGNKVFDDVQVIHYKGENYNLKGDGLLYDKDMNYVENDSEILEKGKYAHKDFTLSIPNLIMESATQIGLMTGAAKMTTLTQKLGAGLLGQDLVYGLSSFRDNYNVIAEMYPEATERERIAYAGPLSLLDSMFARIMPDYKFFQYNPTRAILNTIKSQGKHLTANGIVNTGGKLFTNVTKEYVEEYGVAGSEKLWNIATNYLFESNKLNETITSEEAATIAAITPIATAGMSSKSAFKNIQTSRIDLNHALVFAARDTQTNQELKALLQSPKFAELTSEQYVSDLKAKLFEMEKQTANLPKDLSIEATIESFPLIEERNMLEQKKAETDKAFHAPLDLKIKEVNKQLGELYAKDLSNKTNDETNRQGQGGPQIEGSASQGDGNNQNIKTEETPNRQTINEVVKGVSDKMMETGLAEGYHMQTQEQFDQKLQEVGKGEVKGNIKAFVHEGQIYFNQDKITPTDSVHEFGHLWTDFTKENSPEVLEQGVNLINNEGQVYLDEAKRDNPELEGDALVEEALVRAIADQGGKIVNESQKRTFTDWLSNLWDNIAFKLGIKGKTSMEIQSMNLQEFAEAVSTDLLQGNKISDAPVKSSEVKFSKSNIDYSSQIKQNSRFDNKRITDSDIKEIEDQLKEYNKNDNKTDQQIERRINSALNSKIKERRKIELSQNTKEIRSKIKKDKRISEFLNIDTKYLSHQSALEFEKIISDLAQMKADKISKKLTDDVINKFKERASTGKMNQHIDNAIKEGGNRISEAHAEVVNAIHELIDDMIDINKTKKPVKLPSGKVKALAAAVIKFNKNNDKTKMEMREKIEAITQKALLDHTKLEAGKIKKEIRSKMKGDKGLKYAANDDVKESLRIDTSAFNVNEMSEYYGILVDIRDGMKNYKAEKDGTVNNKANYNQTLDFTHDYNNSGKTIFEYLQDIERTANRRRFRASMVKVPLSRLGFSPAEIKLMNTPNYELSSDEKDLKQVLLDQEIHERDQLKDVTDKMADEDIDLLMSEKSNEELGSVKAEKRRALMENHRKAIINYAKHAILAIEASGDKDIQFVKDLDLEHMMTEDLLSLNKMVNNYLVNGDRTMIAKFREIAKAEEAIKDIKKMDEFLGVGKNEGGGAIKRTVMTPLYKFRDNIWRPYVSLNLYLDSITGGSSIGSKLYDKLGFFDLSAGATRTKQKVTSFHEGFIKVLEHAKKVNNRDVDLTSNSENIRRAVLGNLLQANYNSEISRSSDVQQRIDKNNEFEFRKQIDRYLQATIDSYKKYGDSSKSKSSDQGIIDILEGIKKELEIDNVLTKADLIKYLEHKDKGNYAILKYVNSQFNGISEDFQRVANELHNKRPKIYEESDFYLPMSRRSLINGPFKQSRKEQFVNGVNERFDIDSQSAHNIDRQSNARLSKGEVINLDFDTMVGDSFQSQVFDIETSPAIIRMSYIFTNPDMVEKFGSHLDHLQNRAARAIMINRGDVRVKEDMVSKMLSPVLRRLQTFGAVSALGGFTQIIKQPFSVMYSAMHRSLLNSNSIKGGPYSYSDQIISAGLDLAKFGAMGTSAKDIPLLQQSSIYYRDDANVQYGWATDRVEGSSMSGHNKTKTRRAVSKITDEKDGYVAKGHRLLMRPLTFGDAFAANASFLMYYRNYLKQRGLDVDDFKTEHTKIDDSKEGKVRREALVYAQHMINTTQLTSDFAEGSPLFYDTPTTMKFISGVLFSFQRMSNNAKARNGVAISNIMYGKNVKENLAEISATVAESVVFQGIKQFMLAPLWIAAGSLLTSAFFDDDDEKGGIFDDYMDNMFSYVQKFGSSVLGDLAPSQEGFTMEAANWILYAYDKSMNNLPAEMTFETFIKSKKDYNKRSKDNLDKEWYFYSYEKQNPTILDHLGVYGILGNNVLEAGQSLRTFQGTVSEDNSFGGVNVYDYSNENKVLLATHAIFNVLGAASLMDADLLRQERKLFNQQVKQKNKVGSLQLSNSNDPSSSKNSGVKSGVKKVGSSNSSGSSSRSSRSTRGTRSANRSSRSTSSRGSRRSSSGRSSRGRKRS